MNKDVNKKLLYLILVFFIVLILITVYYNRILNNLSISYKKSLEQLGEVTSKFIIEETKSDEVSQLKEFVLRDKQALEEGYTDLKNENELLKEDKYNLQQELLSVKAELSNTKSELEQQKNNFEIIKARYKEVSDSLEKAYHEKSELLSRVKDLCSNLIAEGGSDNEC